MQDIHSGETPSASRLFAAAAAAGDRHLLRTFQHHLNPHPNDQALKCPRCDSLNTKFCYYNNYNLSQPRHFCKSCRRYWTKGGVLRNVPVGGGCRKSRRSSSSSTSRPPSAKSKARDDTATTSSKTSNNNNNNNTLSSGDSSTLSAAATAELPSLFHEYGSSSLKQSLTEMLYRAEDVGAEIGSFAGIMGSTAEMTPFGYAGALNQHDDDAYRRKQTHQQGTAVVDGFAQFDWGGGGGREENNGGDRGGGLFEVTGAVDHAYWSQQNQWTALEGDADHHLHLHQQHQRGGDLNF